MSQNLYPDFYNHCQFLPSLSPCTCYLFQFHCGLPPFYHWLASSPDCHPFPQWSVQVTFDPPDSCISSKPFACCLFTTLMMEAVCTSETSGYCNETTECYILKGIDLFPIQNNDNINTVHYVAPGLWMLAMVGRSGNLSHSRRVTSPISCGTCKPQFEKLLWHTSL
jgi:hypothetical protein